MSPNLSQKIWQTLEKVTGLATVTAEWQALLASEYEAFRKFLRPTSQRATCYPCLATPPCGCAHAVILHAPNDIVTVCRCEPPHCETTPVQRQDLVIYEVNLMALGEAIISALGLVRDNTGVADLHRTLRLGTYCPLPGYRVPVFLTIQLEPDDFRRVIETLVVDNDESFVVLAPTQELFSPACEKWLQKRKARFLSLVDFLTMQRNGTLVPRVSSEELFTGVREAVIPTVAQTYPEQNTDPKSLNRFVLQSGYWWSITYRGKTCVLKDTKGMHYLEMLIRKQGQELHVSDLYYLINRRPTQTEDPTLSVMTEEALDEIGLTLSGLSDAGEAIDETAKKQIRTRLKQIEEKIEEAKEFGNEEAQFKREQEREQLIQYLSSSLGFSGRTRRSIDPIERIRKTVSNAIQRTCKAILEDSPELGRHLTNSLSTGSFCAYKPEAPTYWSFS